MTADWPPRELQTSTNHWHIDHDEQTRSVVCESLPACFVPLFGQTALANRQTQTKLSMALTERGGGAELWMGLILRERRENWSPLTVREPQVALTSSDRHWPPSAFPGSHTLHWLDPSLFDEFIFSWRRIVLRRVNYVVDIQLWWSQSQRFVFIVFVLRVRGEILAPIEI